MMNLKRIFPALLILFVLGLTFTSCEKDLLDLDNNETTETTEDGNLLTGNGDEDDENGDKEDCFTVNYPIDVIVAGETQTVNSDEELEAIFEGMNEDEEKDFEFVFPINVTMTEDGSTLTLNSIEEIIRLKKDCYGDWDDHHGDHHDDDYDEDFTDCFEVNYPISIVLEDGTTKEITSDEELERLFGDCRDDEDEEDDEDEDEDDEDDEDDENEYGEDFEFVYPITVTMTEDGSTVTLNSDDDLDNLFDDCFGDWDEDYEDDYDFTDCFEVNYPIDANTPDGVVTISNDEELEGFLERMDHDEEGYSIAYPVTVTLAEDGSNVTVNSDDDIEDLFEDCFGDWDEDEEDFDLADCFEVNFPIEANTPDGVVTINNDEELEGFLERMDYSDDFSIVYPIDVTLTEDGSTKTLNSDDEVEDLLDTCFD